MVEVEDTDRQLEVGLERDRGFLIHIARTFPGMVPYLKGIHHTLESWRTGRDKDGWRFNTEEWIKYLSGGDGRCRY